jgi:hypothetical protein
MATPDRRPHSEELVSYSDSLGHSPHPYNTNNHRHFTRQQADGARRSTSPSQTASPQSVNPRDRLYSHSNRAPGGSSASYSPVDEENLTVKRREANRLAAQRFRSRKKGYQDGLEEKVRLLEEEKDILLRQLGTNGHSVKTEEGMSGRKSSAERRKDTSRSGSPRRSRDLDLGVRLSSLDAANRHLQDELKSVYEENLSLRKELDRWREWDKRQTEKQLERETPRSSVSDHRVRAERTRL